jgi:hypothetical protein
MKQLWRDLTTLARANHLVIDFDSANSFGSNFSAGLSHNFIQTERQQQHLDQARSHPEKDDRATKFDEMAKDMLMADTAAALEHETIKTLGSTRLSAVQVETLNSKT